MIYSIYLKHFYYAARFQSIRKAARYCDVTQPAVSRSVRILEEELQVPLLVRTKNSSQLTEYGQSPFKFAERYQNQSQAIRKSFLEMKERVGALRIGINKHYEQALLPLVEQFMREESEISVELKFADGEEIREGFEKHSFDVVFVINYDPLERASYFLESNSKYLFEDKIRLCCASGHPLVSAKKFSLSDIARYQFLIPSFYVEPIKEQFEASNLNLKVRATMNHGKLVSNLLKTSDCLAILATKTLSREDRAGIHFLETPQFNREFVVVAKFLEQSNFGSPRGRQLFWKFLENHREDFLSSAI